MELPFIENRLIVSIYDYSGQWPADYIAAGYPVILWDYKKEGCILQKFNRLYGEILDAVEAGFIPWGLMGAPPCTDVSNAGAQYWPTKDSAQAPEPYAPWTQTEYAKSMIEIFLHLVHLFPWTWWTMENPPGRLEKLVPEAAPFRKMLFNPFDYGDPYPKKTILWGEFNTDLCKLPVKPVTVTQTTNGRAYQTSEMMYKTGGKSERTKTVRSNTPRGFAKAFFTANP